MPMRSQPEKHAGHRIYNPRNQQADKIAVKILAARQVVSGSLNAVRALIAAMRREAQWQPGYIIGETLDPQPQSSEILVVSTWQSIEDWNRWFDHPLRLRLQKQMDSYLIGRTAYTIYRDL
jgi:heme-degrading monooxygenase HmoA